MVGDGKPAEVIANYLHQTHSAGTERVWTEESAPGNDLAQILSIRALPHEGMPPGVVDVRRPIGIEIGFKVLREGKPLFPKIKVLDEEGAVAFNAMDTDERWLQPDAAGRVRRDRVDPGQPAERGHGDRRGRDLQPRLPEARAPRGGLRGGLVRGARPGRGRLGARPVQRSVARRRPAAARLDRRAHCRAMTSGALRSPSLHEERVTQPDATSVSVVVSTYEWPEALDAVLRGLASQSDDGFEVVVADDGSGAVTDGRGRPLETPSLETALSMHRKPGRWLPAGADAGISARQTARGKQLSSSTATASRGATSCGRSAAR